MTMIPQSTIDALWPHADVKLRTAIANSDQWLKAAGIVTPLVIAHFMAQVSLECGAGTQLVENLNYREDALLSQWPSHFTPEQAREMAHQPALIANQAYNGRMGNRPGSNDGWTYRGRGGTQTTGRDSYTKLAQQTGIDLVNHPELINDPLYFMEVCTKDFVMCGCLPFAERDEVVEVTKHLNGGTIGLAQREQWLVKWKRVLGVA
jgi:putative chitinase